MRHQTTTIRTVIAKRDDANEARTAALNDRDNQLRAASDMGWALAHTAVIDDTNYATFVDTITLTTEG